MIGGKKIQNFITFQTKQTIFLKQNSPQLIVHQHIIETDSFKQLLSTKRSKNKPNLFQNVNLKQEKQNFQNNEFTNSQNQRKSNFTSSNSKSKNTSKQRSNSARYKFKENDKFFNPLGKVKQFDPKDQTKRSRSAKNKMSKKVKSMIRLPKFAQKNFFDLDPSKINRKSCSPFRNNSEGMKRTNTNNYSTQCIKTTKFTESKDTTLKHLKSTKIDKNLKKQTGSNKTKKLKSKEKVKSKTKINNDIKGYVTQRKKEDEIFMKIDQQRGKKIPKKYSPPKKSQIQKKKIQQQPNKQFKGIKQKPLTKKRKSMSKSKKNLHHFQSVDEILLRNQKYETSRNESSGMANYLSNRDSFKKKVKTDRDSLNKPNKKVSQIRQKEIIISSKNLKKLQNEAATKIQKVYKGFITRKWLGQYLKIIASAVVIQKHWRGYMSRKKFFEMKQKNQIKKSQIIASPRAESIFKGSFDEASINMDKWKDILFEVMEQHTVNQKLKSRIKQFLQHQNYHSARSSVISQKSQRSHNSEQKLQQEIESERRYFAKRQKKIQMNESSNKKSRIYLESSPQSFKVNDNSMMMEIQSPSERRSSRKQSHLLSHLMSPQGIAPISPKLRKAQSPQVRKNQSPEKMINNLQQIQNYQRQNIIKQANLQKCQLQELLKKNVFSPRSYKIKKEQIDKKMQESLKQFNKNIENVINSCKRSTIIEMNAKQVQSFTQSVAITPENSQVKETIVRQQIENLSQNEVKSRLFQKVVGNNDNFDLIQSSQKGIQLKDAKSMKFELSPQKELPTYENFETFNVNALSSQHQQNPPKEEMFVAIDLSYSFLDEYLLTLIEHLRGKDDGKVMLEIVKNVKNFRNLEAYAVLRNLSVVKEQNPLEDDGFSLPMYKYLQDDMEIIKQDYVQDYNKYFHVKYFLKKMMRSAHKFHQQKSIEGNQPLEHYLKLLVDAFNEALNLKRPNCYIFTDRAIESYNSKLITEREQFDAESEYDMYCAGAMQEIFTWFSVKYGCIVSANEQQTTIEQIMTHNNEKLNQIVKMQVQKKWDQYYQKIQTIAKLSDQLFEEFLFKEVVTILNVQKKFLKERQLLR